MNIQGILLIVRSLLVVCSHRRGTRGAATDARPSEPFSTGTVQGPSPRSRVQRHV